MSRMQVYLILLLAYVGARLLPDLPFGIAGVAVGVGVLVAWAWLIPFGFRYRRAGVTARSRRLMWAGLVALGGFSTLVVLTFLRDMGLLAVLGLDMTHVP